MSARRLLLGDWHPFMRDGIDLLRALLVASAAGFLLAGDGRAATVLGVMAAVALLVRPLLLPRPFDLAVVLACLLQGWGEALRLYDDVAWFDTVVHFTIPLLGAPVVYVLLARLDVVPDPRDETGPRHLAGVFVVTLALGLAIGALWEMIEYASDNVLGSRLQLGNADTVGDLTADGLGALCGAVLLLLWTLRGWGSVRRIPGDNTREIVDDDAPAPPDSRPPAERVSSASRRRRAAGPGSRAGSR